MASSFSTPPGNFLLFLHYLGTEGLLGRLKARSTQSLPLCLDHTSAFYLLVCKLVASSTLSLKQPSWTRISSSKQNL